MRNFVRSMFGGGTSKSDQATVKVVADAADKFVMPKITHGVHLGEKYLIKFVGIFPATNRHASLLRKCVIVFSSPEIVVAQDEANQMTYVISVEKMMSLGCRMSVEIFDAKGKAVLTNRTKEVGA
jgi:hypothetical protein